MPFILEVMTDGRIDRNRVSRLITGKVQLKDTVGFKELLENKETQLKILVERPNWH